MKSADLFPFKVNGEEIESQYQKVVAREILKLAKEHGAIVGSPESYILKDLPIDDKQYDLDEEVDLAVDKEFITISDTRTVVA